MSDTPERTRGTRSITRTIEDRLADLDDDRPEPAPVSKSSGLWIGLAAVGLIVAFAVGLVLIRGRESVVAEEPKQPRDGLALMSIDEIKANASKSVPTEAKQPVSATPKAYVVDPTRASAKDGSQTVDGVTARILSISVDHDIQVVSMGLNWGKKVPLFYVSIAFRAEPGQEREYSNTGEYPTAAMYDEIGRKYSQVNFGIPKKSKPIKLKSTEDQRYGFYFEIPNKSRPMTIDFRIPATKGTQPYRFHFPAEMIRPDK